MNKPISIKLQLLALSMTAALSAVAADLDQATQARLDGEIKKVQAWATDAVIVNAVKGHNSSVPADQAGMTQEKWKSATILDPLIRSFTRTEAAQFIKAKKSEAVSEAFLSDAQGLKVGFLAKTSSWSHKGKDKHEVPMTGKIWQGPVETDESTGVRQVQVGFPVLDGGKAIGSLVVGFSISKLGT